MMLLPVNGLAGLEAVGQVQDTINTGLRTYGARGRPPTPRTPFLTPAPPPQHPARPRSCDRPAKASRYARDTALERLRQEAAAPGADGVVGVRITGNPIARFPTGHPPTTSSLTFLPLRSSR